MKQPPLRFPLRVPIFRVLFFRYVWLLTLALDFWFFSSFAAFFKFLHFAFGARLFFSFSAKSRALATLASSLLASGSTPIRNRASFTGFVTRSGRERLRRGICQQFLE